jgi:hypothetical protein
LTNSPGTGTADVGRAHLGKGISVCAPFHLYDCINLNKFQRDDVAKVLALLVDRKDAAGLAIDFVGGDTPIEDGLDSFIKKGETDFLG